MKLRAGAAALACGAALAGCGGGEPQQHVGAPDLGVPVRLADCSDWRDATVGERLGTVRELRDFAGEPVGSSKLERGAVLDDEKAYELLDSNCSSESARAFKLYKLYTRAAAFEGVAVPSGQPAK